MRLLPNVKQRRTGNAPPGALHTGPGTLHTSPGTLHTGPGTLYTSSPLEPDVHMSLSSTATSVLLISMQGVSWAEADSQGHLL